MSSSSVPFDGVQTAMGRPPKWRGLVVLFAGMLTLLSGLCTLFALVVTASQARQEHIWALWPQVTAQVQGCSVNVYTYKPRRYRIDCGIRYQVHGEEIVSHLYSGSVRDPRRVLGPNPGARVDLIQDWVDAHPLGTPVVVHYDPADPRKPVLVATDMPGGGPRTPDNLKLLIFFAASCAVLLAITRIAWPKTAALSSNS